MTVSAINGVCRAFWIKDNITRFAKMGFIITKHSTVTANNISNFVRYLNMFCALKARVGINVANLYYIKGWKRHWLVIKGVVKMKLHKIRHINYLIFILA